VKPRGAAALTPKPACSRTQSARSPSSTVGRAKNAHADALANAEMDEAAEASSKIVDRRGAVALVVRLLTAEVKLRASRSGERSNHRRHAARGFAIAS